MFSEDLSAFVQDFGSPVIYMNSLTGPQKTMAIFNRPDTEILGGRVQSTDYRIEYPATELVGLKNGDSLLIGIGDGWIFDPNQSRLQYVGSSSAPDSGMFKVLGTPNFLDDGTFLQARLERIS